MNKKIVIIPVFCEAHMIQYQIPNIIETIDPDYIIYNEGMFPRGPESSTIVNEQFINDYTLDGKRGFDFNILENIIKDAQTKYPDTKIILNKMDYDGIQSAPECYLKACSNFEEFGIKITKGDYIFPFEGDVFHHENAKKEIDGYLEQLEPDTGFTSNWIDFLETQYYCEKSTLNPFNGLGEGRHRRICIRFGTWEFYHDVLLNFMTQKYPMLYPTDLTTYHYVWWRPKKYKQLRYDQLQRPLPYWQKFDDNLNIIRSLQEVDNGDIVIRPNRNDVHRYASHVNIEHPVHIKQHENWINNEN
jgi:hypothetical protein